LGLDS